MKEIIDRLQEGRQIELAKSILESNGYKVSKKVNKHDDYLAEGAASLEYLKSKMISISDLLDNFGGIKQFAAERDGTDELDIPCEMLGGNYDNVYMISDQDEGGPEVLKIIRGLDSKEVSRKNIPYVASNILMDSPLGKYVYQNQSGMEVIFMKF